MIVSRSRLFIFVMKLYLIVVLYKFLISSIFRKEFLTQFVFSSCLLIFTTILIYTAKKEFSYFRIKYVNIIIYILICLLIINFINSLLYIPQGTNYNFIIINFFQVLYPLMLLYVCFNLPTIIVSNLSKFIYNLSIPIMVIGYIEFLIPKSTREHLIFEFIKLSEGVGYIPNSYYFEYHNIMRLGSILFEPLTLSYILLFVVMYIFSNNYSSITKLKFWGLLFLTFGKSAIVTSIIAFFSSILKYISVILMLIILMLILIVLFNPQIISKTNYNFWAHYEGLSSGIQAGLNKPIMGNGLGTAGYIIKLKCIELEIIGPFFNGSNGNESTIGVIAYQLGIVWVIIFVLLYILISIRLIRNKSYFAFGIVFGTLLGLLFTESLLSNVIVTVFSFLIVNEYKKNSNN